MFQHPEASWIQVVDGSEPEQSGFSTVESIEVDSASVVSATSTGSAGRAEAQELRSQTWKHESAAASAASDSANLDIEKPAEPAEPAVRESSQASTPRGTLDQMDYDLLHNLVDSLRSLDKQLGARSAPRDASTSDPAGHSALQIFSFFL